MKRSTPLPELLCPAGNMECLLAAVEGGADAVYVGGKRFGARAYAGNFDTEELIRATDYCHLHGVKLYVTVNTLLEDGELSDALEYCRYLYEIGVDAVIVADLGLISLLRRYLPSLELHASTQLSVHNSLGADAAYKLGCTRVVPARELSGEDIRRVTEVCKPEIEVFLHGALCVCHSGQCLFSSLVGGRSGNRGECAQPCRLPYGGDKYPLSLCDLSLSGHIRELVDSGVCSLKIEGRMKSADYVYTVASIYRRLLDECRPATSEEDRRLRQAFSRGGFTDGYFTGKKDSAMCGVRSEKDKKDSREMGARSFSPARITVKAKARLKLGEPAELSLYTDDRRVTVKGDIPTAAINAPLTHEAVAARLAKMGNTFLSLPTDNIEIELDEGINLSPSAINALRRDAAFAFESSKRTDAPASIPKFEAHRKPCEPIRTAELLRERTLSEELADAFDILFLPVLSSEDNLCKVNGVHLPPVIGESEIPEITEAMKKAKALGIRYALVQNIGQIALADSVGLVPCGGFRLNVANSAAADLIEAMGVKNPILSPELTLPKARDICGGVVVLGKIPLMITERCFIKENFGCDKCDKAVLTDRKGEKFPMMREYGHRNLIINSTLTYMGDKQDELHRGRIRAQHFIFTTETSDQAKGLLRAFNRGERPSGVTLRRLGRRDVKS